MMTLVIVLDSAVITLSCVSLFFSWRARHWANEAKRQTKRMASFTDEADYGRP